VEPKDWLLCFIRVCEVNRAPDPIRIMKGMFIFSQEGGVKREESYEFEAYSYGPCSFAIYRDLERLLEEGVIAVTPMPGQNWSLYTCSAAGQLRADDLLSKSRAGSVAKLRESSDFVLSRSFLSLLRDVYQRYPQYARNSVLSFR